MIGKMKISIDAMQIKTSTKPLVFNPLEKIIETLETVYPPRRRSPNILIAPEWFFLSPRRMMYSEKEYQGIMRSLESISLDYPNTLLIPGTIAVEKNGFYRNTAPIVHNGRSRQYVKRFDGGDVEYAQSKGLRWKPGKAYQKNIKHPDIIDWKDIRVGIQICQDHCSRSVSRRVDVHIVVACGLSSPSSYSVHNLRSDGILVLDDGNEPRAMAWCPTYDPVLDEQYLGMRRPSCVNKISYGFVMSWDHIVQKRRLT